MSKLFLDTLDNKRLEVFKKLKDFSQYGVLGGGTALALQIGHRKSYDFDFFVNEPISKYIWKKVKDTFGANSYKTLDTQDQLDVVTQNGVNLTFFLDDYKSMFPVIKSNDINLMSIQDIACNKAFIQGRRPKWRDYVDLYFILKENHVTLEKLIINCLKKFGNDFSKKLFLEQLIYWNDIYNYRIEYVDKDINPEVIKRFLLEEVKKVAKFGSVD